MGKGTKRGRSTGDERVSKRSGRSSSSSSSARLAKSKRLNRRGTSRPELGYVDVDRSEPATYMYCNEDIVASNIQILNVIPQGAGITQRVGKKVLLKSFQMRGWSYGNDSHGVSDNFAMLIYDKRPQGTMPSASDILDLTGIASANSAMNNDANSGRFIILKRWNWTLCGNPGQGPLATGVGIPPSVNCWLNISGTTAKNLDDYVDLKMRPTVYKAAGTGAIGDIEEGALYFMCGGSGQGATNAKLGVGFRVRFVDV